MQNIRGMFAQTLFVVHPEYGELKNGRVREDTTNLRQYLPEVRFLLMSDYLPKVNSETLNRWYNIEHHDMHPSDEGCKIYGEVLAEHLLSEVKALEKPNP